MSAKQLNAVGIRQQILEDHNVSIPLEVIKFELDKFFFNKPIRTLKEIDIWIVAFQEFYVQIKEENLNDIG